MILGIGIDLVEVNRIERLLMLYGDRFVDRVLTQDERAQYATTSRPVWFLANRFAAKEAVSKALGTGLRHPVTLQAVSVISDGIGRPYFRFHDQLSGYLETRRVSGAHLSITNEKGLACAVVVLESSV